MRNKRFLARKSHTLEVQFIRDRKLAELPVPQLAANFIPEWYKQVPMVSGPSDFGPAAPPAPSVRRCMPFLDIMTAGYIIPLWCDLAVTRREEDNELSFTWFGGLNYRLIEDQGGAVGIPGADRAYKLVSPWNIITPPGVSCLFTAPFNHDPNDRQMDFWSGIVDTDTYPSRVNFPFRWVGSDLDVVLSGTPIMQVIPFVRNSFNFTVIHEESVESMDTLKSAQVSTSIKAKFGGVYRRTMWHKKDWVK